MSAPASHCPFLNRADSRCSKHFSLDRLDSAFEDCFGEYKSCAVYGEQLAERRERRMNASLGRDGADATTPVIQVTFHGRPGAATRASADAPRASADATRACAESARRPQFAA